MRCKCGGPAITPDGLCKGCFFVREEWRYETKWKTKYDRRFRGKKK